MRALVRIPLMGLNGSGGIRVVTQIANYLAQNGWSVEIIVPDYMSASYFQLDFRVRLALVRTVGPRQVRRFFYLTYLGIFACRNVDICVATSYLTPYLIYFSWLINARRASLVYIIQAYEPLSRVLLDPRKSPLVKFFLYWLARWGYRLPFNKIAVSGWVKDQINKGDIVVIPNGIDLDVFHPAHGQQQPERAPVIGTIGRAGPTKGLDTFVRVMERFRKRREARVLILSNEELSLPDGFELVRANNDKEIAQFYRSCSIFIFTSTVEGFGLPPLEAMACGVPVVCTDCGGIREYANEHNCVIIPPGDEDAILEAINQLLADDRFRTRIAENGRETATRYSKGRMCAEYLNRFTVLLQNDRL